MTGWRRFREPLAVIVFVCLLAVLINSLWLVFDLGFWSFDLTNHHVWAIEFARAVRQGEVYPRWLRMGFHGLGEPVFLYYSPLMFYATALIRWIVPTTWSAMAWAETGAVAAAALAGYWAVRRAADWRAAAFAAIVLASAPYLFWCNFYYGWVGAAFAFPALAAATAALPSGRPGAINVALAVAICLTILSHTLTGFMAVMCLPFFCAAYLGAPPAQAIRRSLALWASIGLGIGLSLFYLYPALLSLSLVSSDNWTGYYASDWRRSFALPVVTAMLYGVRWPAVQWGLGIPAVLPILAATFDLWRRGQRDQRWWTILGLVTVAWVATLLGSELSYPLWGLHTPLLNIQYPSRFIAVMSAAGLLANLLCAAHRWESGERRRAALLAVPLLLSVMATAGIYAKMALVDGQPASRPDDARQTYPGLREYLPRSAAPGWSTYVAAGGLPHECETVGVVCRETGVPRAPAWEIVAPQAVRLRLPLFAFPTWSLTIDGAATPVTTDPATGLTAVELSPGRHVVAAIWQRLPAEYVGMALSVGALALLFVACLFGSGFRRQPAAARV
jgi:uncharacterized membrane protein